MSGASTRACDKVMMLRADLLAEKAIHETIALRAPAEETFTTEDGSAFGAGDAMRVASAIGHQLDGAPAFLISILVPHGIARGCSSPGTAACTARRSASRAR
jgi:hypothetical protein